MGWRTRTPHLFTFAQATSTLCGGDYGKLWRRRVSLAHGRLYILHAKPEDPELRLFGSVLQNLLQ